MAKKPNDDNIAATKTTPDDYAKAAKEFAKNTAAQKAAIQASADAMEAARRAAEKYFQTTEKVAESSIKSADAIQKISDNAKEQVKKLASVSDSLESVSEGQKVYNDLLKLGSKAVKNASKDITKQTNDFSKNSKAATAAAVALKTFGATIKGLKAIFGGVTGVIGKFVELIWEVGSAIVSAPFMLMESLIGRAKEAMGQGLELATAREEVREIFGDISKGTSKDVINIGRSLATGVIAPGLMARQVFGTFAEALDRIRELAAETPVLFQKLGDQFNNSGLQIMSMASGLGIAKEELAGLQSRAVATGEPLTATLSEVTKYAKGLGAQFGINSKAMSRDMGRAMKDVKHFANATVKEVAQATVYAHKLGLELKDITGVLDAFNTFDQAAENVAKLSQAFGVNIDLMKLMEAKTPADALDEIKKAFTAAGKSADQMSRQELQLIAQTTNLSEEQVRQGLSMKNAGVSMDAVKSSASALQAQTMDTGQAITALATDIKRLVKAGQAPEGKSFFEIFLEGFVKGIDLSGEFQKLIQAVMKDIWIVRDAGMKVGQAFVKFFPGFTEFLQGLRAFLDPAKMKSMMSGITSVFIDFFKQLGNGTATFEGLIEALKTKFITFFDNDKGGRLLLGGLTKMWKAVERIISTGLDWLTEKLKTGIQFLVDLLSGKYANGLSAAGEGILGGLGAAGKSPIVQSLINAYEQLKDPLGQLFEKVFNLAIDKLGKILSEYKWEIALVTLGPTLGSLLIQGIGAALSSPAALSALAAAGPYIAAAAGVALAGYQAKQLYDEMDHTYKVEAQALAEHSAEMFKDDTKYIAINIAALQKQNIELEKSYKLGQLTTEEYNNQSAILAKSFTEQDLTKKFEEAYKQRFEKTAKEFRDELDSWNTWGGISTDDMDTRLNALGEFITKTSTESIAAQRSAIKELGREAARAQKEYGLEGSVGVNKVLELAKSGKVSLSAMAGSSIEDIKNVFGEMEVGLKVEEAALVRLFAMREAQEKALRNREMATAESRNEALLAARAEVESLSGPLDAVARVAAEGRVRALEVASGADYQASERVGTTTVQSAAKEKASQPENMLESLGLGAGFTIETAEEQLNKVDALAKKVLSKDFNLDKTISDIKDKFTSVKDWKIIDASAEEGLKKAGASMGELLNVFENIKKTLANIAEASSVAQSLNKTKIEAVSAATQSSINIASEAVKTIGTTDYSNFSTQAQSVEKGFSAINLAVSAINSLAPLAAALGNADIPGTKMNAVKTAMFDIFQVPADIMFQKFTDNNLSAVDFDLFAQKATSVKNGYEAFAEAAPAASKAAQQASTMPKFNTEALQQHLTSMTAASTVFSNIAPVLKNISTVVNDLNSLKIAEAIGKMVEDMNSINKSLSNVNIGKDGQVRVKLGDTAKGIMKADEVFNIKKAPININMEVHVELSAARVEKAIMQASTVIKPLFRELGEKQTPAVAPTDSGGWIQKAES